MDITPTSIAQSPDTGENVPLNIDDAAPQDAVAGANQDITAQAAEPKAIDARKDSIPEVDLTQTKDTPQPSNETEQGTKRTHEESSPTPPLLEDPDYLRSLMPPPKTCNEVRRSIRTLIEGGGMKVGEFCNAIHVSNNAYNNFMKKNGKYDGRDCAAYYNAMAFFFTREEEGIPLPKKQKTQKKDEQGKGKEKEKEKEKDKVPDLSDVHLDGEETDSVPVYDTCDDIRRQISAYLRKPGVTQAQFSRDLAKQFHTDQTASKISASMLNSFRGKKGADAGNTSSVFYAAYVFFEKMRVMDGKKKSKKRQEMEEVWGPDGFDRETSHNNRGILCLATDRVTKDKYGKFHSYRPGFGQEF